MVPLTDDPHPQNEETYDQLISLIENSQGRLAPIIVACDDSRLRQQIVMRYEAEARQAKICPYRIVLGQEPSLRAGLVALKQQDNQLQQGGTAVFTVTGAELLLRVKLNSQDEQSELDKFFGYLQWTREGLREFPYPIVLWVTERIFLEMRRRAPDFWSWRKATLRFADESSQLVQISAVANPQVRQAQDTPDTEFLPPLTELQAEIAELIAKDPDSPGLAPLYNRLGQVYAQRVRQGIAQNLEQEREQAIAAFQQSLTRYHTQNNPAAEMGTLNRLGNFFKSQSRYLEAIAHHQKSLDIAREIGYRSGEGGNLGNLGNSYCSLGQYQEAIDLHQRSLEILHEIGDRQGEASSLNNLGNAYNSLGHYQEAIDLHQRSLEILHEIGDRQGEASSLNNLGNAYASLGQYQRAIEFYQQALETYREVGDLYGEANALGNLGNVYYSLGQYQRAIDFQQQFLEVGREIGDLNGEANVLLNIAMSLAKLGQSWEAKQHYQQAKQIYQSLSLEHSVERCNTAIDQLNQIIPAQQSIHSPNVRDE